MASFNVMNVQLFIYDQSVVEFVIAIGYIDNVIGVCLLVLLIIDFVFRG